MIAIKYMPKHKYYVVCDGVMEQYAKFNADGTFTGNAGISVHPVTRLFNSLSEAKEAKQAFEQFVAKYR